MNKRQIIASLNKIANELDNTGLHKEATDLTNIMVKLAEEEYSKVDRAIERFKRSCERISSSKRTFQEKLTERMISRHEISENLNGEDLEKFNRAANNISVD